MRKRRLIGALALSGIALTIIVSIAYAAIEPGPFQVDGVLNVQNTGGGDGIALIPRVFGNDSFNWIQMGIDGTDLFDFGGGFAQIIFTDPNFFVPSGDEDVISYTDWGDGDSLNDLLVVRADNVTILSNGGDVIITLGN